ncbi:alpha amylase [Pseudovirgaria hyperparasitica]|uniref:Alpha amylase n=1 Tax=Pseudovirgaria hyperparasitica TaxID=470096 RepID=A0A6A6W0K4_9PEZI|nr:alpha amylase [Pseudovirgaria hyperparasitica]KAF2756448.1 alpha amylase [Pseudovirgaria hyperparasitica]
MSPNGQSPQWWHRASVYQIYPASFKDSNADGIGDIQGIIQKVPYIASLGVDAVWLSPCYESPLVDMGYDISDYRKIDPKYGSVEDIETLIKELGKHNIKLLMDLVVNHTSDQHAWFKESRSSKDNPKRNWYVWRKGTKETNPDGTFELRPPNNWESLFKGSAWTYDELTDEWYLRIFASEQPDLNWENPDTRKAVHDDMRFWLDKGIGGFRMDVINMISKPEGLPNVQVTKPGPYQPAHDLYCNGPRIHEFINEINTQVLAAYKDIMTVGEVPFTRDPEVVRKYVEPARKELSMLFQFDIVDLDTVGGPGGKFHHVPVTPHMLKKTVTKWQTALSYSKGAWATVFLESHDTARSVTRFGDGTSKNRFKVAKMLSLMLNSLMGTVFIMQGQEIGIANYTADIDLEQYTDIETKGLWNEIYAERKWKSGHADPDMSDVMQQVRLKARDHGRIPMPWRHGAKNAGFSDADKPWAPINTDVAECNFSDQDKDTASVLNFWRNMLQLRKEWSDTLVLGDFVPVDIDEGPVFAYKRVGASGNGVLAVMNLSNEEALTWQSPADMKCDFKLIKSTSSVENAEKMVNVSGQAVKLTLHAYDGFLFGL